MSKAIVHRDSQVFGFNNSLESFNGQQQEEEEQQQKLLMKQDLQQKQDLTTVGINGSGESASVRDTAKPMSVLEENDALSSVQNSAAINPAQSAANGDAVEAAAEAAVAEIMGLDCLVSDECDPTDFFFSEAGVEDSPAEHGTAEFDEDFNDDDDEDSTEEDCDEDDNAGKSAEDLLPPGVDQNELIKAAAKEAKRQRQQTPTSSAAAAATSEDSPTKRSKTLFERRNIRRIRDTKVDKATLEAQKAEMERRKRIQEKQQQASAAAAAAKTSTLETLLETKEDRLAAKAAAAAETSTTGSKADKTNDEDEDRDDEEDDDACCIVEPPPAKRSKTSSPTSASAKFLIPSAPSSSSGYYSSSNFSVGRNLLNRVPQYSSLNQLLTGRGVSSPLQQQQETIVIDSDDNEDAGKEDSDAAADKEDEDDGVDVDGKHAKDEHNVPDVSGRVLVNVSHPEDDSDIYLPSRIAKAIRPHQIGGVRFLYDNVVENLQLFNRTPGFGCILAHSMGLGKTLQVCAFCHALFSGVGVKSVLIIVPINTIQNWVAEFNHWLPVDEAACPDEADKRKFALHVISDSCKTMTASQWQEAGGVLLLGYEMFRLLLQKRYKTGGGGGNSSRSLSRKSGSSASLQTQSGSQSQSQPKPEPDPIVIDVDKEDEALTMWEQVRSALVDPGPQVVICDEGHRIKNSAAGISKALKNLKTRRRVVMTGYPLQNNLLEYWCMVDFVRPNFLGTKQQFSNMFERPISNGQCVDSTLSDRKLMRYRAHVLHELLSGFVQRRSHSVLQKSLPPKTEFVLLLRMSPIQEALYSRFMQSLQSDGLSGWAAANPLKAFAVGCKIWNHPDILYHLLQAKASNLAAAADDLDIDYTCDVDGTGSAKDSAGLTPVQSGASLAESVASTSSTSAAAPAKKSRGRRSTVQKSDNSDLFNNVGSLTNNDNAVLSLDWAEEIMKNYKPNLLENGAKILAFQRILNESVSRDDKLLVFSQSLFTLDLLEQFLRTWPVDPESQDGIKWCKGVSYFRLDGSTAASDREKMINSFNSTDSSAKLFLLSTRAGCLGINLIGANRVVVMDASWNPCHDCQAVCRVYRYGQVKPCYIYRLITDNTMERKIYDRQVSKQSVADRIVDEMNPNCQFTRQQVMLLMDYRPSDAELKPPTQEAVQAAIRESPDFMLERILLGSADAEDDQAAGVAAVQEASSTSGIRAVLTNAPFTHESLLLDRQEAKLTRAEKRKAREFYERDKMHCGLSSTQQQRQRPLVLVIVNSWQAVGGAVAFNASAAAAAKEFEISRRSRGSRGCC
uniref:Helicase ATP-binding domain-containing protein n=1 Tax=Macrostomum lignano TaxID=282301 RepID=A0A1I8HLN3_9PLAT